MTIEHTPWVHCIETPIGRYVFDVHTNRILSVEDAGLFGCIRGLEKGAPVDGPYEKVIGSLKERGFFSSERPAVMQHSMTDLLEHQLEHSIEQMTLQLTQQCNFRCAYCTYAPKEYHAQRGHSGKRMSWQTAKQAVDFFYRHSDEQANPCLGFYGGEPLLEIALLKQAVQYAATLFAGRNLRFTITNNGSLLTYETAQFLNQYDFQVMISLDGSPEVHNRSRKFAATGAGTFSAIQVNLEVIKQKLPDFFNRLSFNIVIDPRFPCDTLYQFFDTDFFSHNTIQSTLIDDSFSMEKTVPTEDYIRLSNIYQARSMLSLLSKYPRNKSPKLVNQNIFVSIDSIRKRIRPSRLPERLSHAGPCLPGQRRLLVNVDGDLFPCERVSETVEEMKIGSLSKGFDYEATRKILNVVSLSEEECRNCWALSLCNLCARACCDPMRLSRASKLSQCDGVRQNAEQELRLYLLLKEFGMDVERVNLTDGVWEVLA